MLECRARSCALHLVSLQVYSQERRLAWDDSRRKCMKVVALILGVLCIVIAAFDAFETVVLPRRVVRRVRLAKIFYRVSWATWSWLGRKMRPGNRREYYLSFYGPLSLIVLLVLWAALFIFGFGLISWGLSLPMHAPASSLSLGGYLYMSEIGRAS